MNAPTDRPTRHRHLAHIHAATKAAGLEGDDYRAWLKKRTGRESCDDLTDAELAALCDWLKGTPAQFRKVYALAREIGFTGFDDPGFRTFTERITKETEPRLLSRLQLIYLIAGLQNWLKSKRTHAAKEGVGPDHGPDPS